MKNAKFVFWTTMGNNPIKWTVAEPCLFRFNNLLKFIQKIYFAQSDISEVIDWQDTVILFLIIQIYLQLWLVV